MSDVKMLEGGVCRVGEVGGGWVERWKGWKRLIE